MKNSMSSFVARGVVAAALTMAPLHVVGAAETWQEHRAEALRRFDEAEKLRAESDPAATAAFAGAARSFAQAAATVPPGERDRFTRSETLYRQSLRATELALRVPPESNCAPSVQDAMHDGAKICTALLELVVAELGADARDAYSDIERMRRDFERTLEDCAPEPPPPASEAPVPEVTAATPPPPAKDATPLPAKDTTPPRWPTVGLWTSVALTGLLGGAALGTGLSRVSDPFHGAAYLSIYNAAVASGRDADPSNDVDSTREDDMCKIARGSGGSVVNTEVAGRCDRWDALGKASIATGIFAGMSLVMAATFLGLKLRRPSQRAGARKPLSIGPSLGRGLGLVVSGSF